MGLAGRIYNDYLMPGRWEHYRSLLVAAKAGGYTFVRHQDSEAALAAGTSRLFFLRHDIDTDLAITRTLFSIERDLSIRSTYYFRRCTADKDLMREIHAFGSEVGYHYEELADHIKARGIRSREDALARMGLIREDFLGNLKAFEDLLGAKVHTIAAHGDWANRRMGLPSTSLMDEPTRRAASIKLEAYDDNLVGSLSFRAADAMYPGLWNPSSPLVAVHSGSPVILLLIHPRHWKRAPLYRFGLDAQRLIEGLRYRLR